MPIVKGEDPDQGLPMRRAGELRVPLLGLGGNHVRRRRGAGKQEVVVASGS